MSTGRRQTRAKKQDLDTTEEGKQQEFDISDQPSSSRSEIVSVEEKSESEPRVSLTGDTDIEGETLQQEGWEFESSESESSASEGPSGFIPRVSTDHTNPNLETRADNPKVIMSKEVTIGGEVIKLADTANVVSDVLTPVFTKKSRVGLSDEKRVDLMTKATKQILPKSSLLDLLSPNFTAEDVLEDTLETSERVGLLHDHMVQYDFADVMTIVVGDEGDPTTIMLTKDLFKDYMSIIPKTVAYSNEWYRKYVDTQAQPWISENLQMGVDFLRNNMTEMLWHEVQSEYKSYPVVQQGGPLVFILMMKAIQQNNDICLKNLATRVEHIKINETDGEDVGKVVNLVMGGIERLRAATKFTTTSGDDFYHTLLKMFQTTSVERFNEVFKAQELEYLKQKNMPDALPNQGTNDKSIDDVLKQAKNLYHTLCTTSEWTGINTKGSHSSFSAEGGGGRGPCWTCGQYGHLSHECPLPEDQQDPAAIQKWKEESPSHWSSRSGSRGRGSSGRG